MVLKSPAEPLRSLADRGIRGAAPVNGGSAAPRHPMLGEHALADRECRFDGSNASARLRAACLDSRAGIDVWSERR